MTKDEALKLALEALEMEAKGYADKHKRLYPTAHALRQAIEQAEQQEPVAYLDEGLGAFYWAKDYKKAVGFTPLYTSPQAKPWVGLTDEEIESIFSSCSVWDKFKYERMLEVKLKEKNT